MKFHRKIGLLVLVGVTLFTSSSLPAYADEIIGKSVVTLGANLTTREQQSILKNMGVSNDVKIIHVTNQDERDYLQGYMSSKKIGTKALSCAKITIEEAGKGISIKTSNVELAESIYANAAITAGIKDATIFIDAPYPVSGTAALTGITKAFEAATGKKLNEEQKQVANEELVRTSEVGQLIKDPDKAAQFMNRVKEEVAKKDPQDAADYKNIIVNVSNEFNIKLDENTLDKLVQFTKNFSNLNIDWNSIQNQLSTLGGKLSEVLSSPQTQTILHTAMDWMGKIFTTIGNFLSSFAK